MSSESLLDVAARVAPAPASREGANRVTWVKHYAALALAAYATFRAEIRTVPRNPEPGSRPDLGYLILTATSATAATVALIGSADAPKLIWDLTPEDAEEWLADTLVRYGVNPGDIDPNLDPADFTEALRVHGPSNQPYVCPDCGETAYLHFPGCSLDSPDGIARAGRWIDASGIPAHPANAVRAWLDGIGVPVPAGIQPLMAEIRRGLIAAGDAGYTAGCAGRATPKPTKKP